MLTSRSAFLLLFFIAACGPFTISILAAARPLGSINSSNSHPHDTLSTVPPHKQVQQFSFCRSTDGGLDCGGFSAENTVDRIGTHITTEVGDIAAAGVLQSQNNGELNDQSTGHEFNDQSTGSYDILRGRTSPPGSPSSINHAAGNSAASTSSYDILRGRTSPPGSPLSINHAAGHSASINHTAGNSVASTGTYDILRGTTSPPGSPPSIHHAAGNSAAMQKTLHCPQSQDC